MENIRKELKITGTFFLLLIISIASYEFSDEYINNNFIHALLIAPSTLIILWGVRNYYNNK